MLGLTIKIKINLFVRVKNSADYVQECEKNKQYNQNYPYCFYLFRYKRNAALGYKSI
jgi:hypothetical protein